MMTMQGEIPSEQLAIEEDQAVSSRFRCKQGVDYLKPETGWPVFTCFREEAKVLLALPQLPQHSQPTKTSQDQRRRFWRGRDASNS